MSADIQKEAVFDDRIVQSRPRYAVEKGALSLTNAPFNAIASTASQMTFNIYVPSENVFVDRALRWSATANLSFTATVPTTTAYATSTATALTSGPYASPGVDFSSCPFPLNYACQTMTATINDTTSVINSQDVLMEVMRMTNYKKNLLQRTCPTMMDKYQANYLGAPPSAGINNPMNGFQEAMNVDEVPNGCWPGLYFTDSVGNRLVGNGFYMVPAGSVPPNPTATPPVVGTGQQIWYVNGVPVVSQQTPVPAGGAAPLLAPTLYVALTSTELLTLSPFVFANDQEHDTGLFGINNIQLIMNFKSGVPLTRLLKTLWASGTTGGSASTSAVLSNIGFNSLASGGVWTNPVMNVQFLTPSLDVPLPPKSVVPYMEFPRYITQSQNGQLGAFGTSTALGQLQSQTITLPQIPDLLLIYVKATQVAGNPDPQDPSYGDGYIPVASVYSPTPVKNPLSINFDNFSGLLSSHTTEELYQMSVENGLHMDFPTWSGLARSSANTAGNGTTLGSNSAYPAKIAGGLVPTVGGFLVLKPSKDITLQSGQAPSLVGNFTLQFNLQVYNTYPFPVQPTLYVITANSGFFESIRGSSRIIKGVLSEQDIISAPVASAQTHEGLRRLVGGRFSFSSLANVFHKAKDIYDKTKPAVSAVRGALPDSGMLGKVKGAMGAVGYGGDSGAGIGAGSGGRRGLSARLM
jgi:hypothetical protein